MAGRGYVNIPWGTPLANYQHLLDAGTPVQYGQKAPTPAGAINHPDYKGPVAMNGWSLDGTPPNLQGQQQPQQQQATQRMATTSVPSTYQPSQPTYGMGQRGGASQPLRAPNPYNRSTWATDGTIYNPSGSGAKPMPIQSPVYRGTGSGRESVERNAQARYDRSVGGRAAAAAGGTTTGGTATPGTSQIGGGIVGGQVGQPQYNFSTGVLSGAPYGMSDDAAKEIRQSVNDQTAIAAQGGQLELDRRFAEESGRLNLARQMAEAEAATGFGNLGARMMEIDSRGDMAREGFLYDLLQGFL